MRNRAKCRICQTIIESLAFSDVVSCSCGEITIWGSSSELKSLAKDYANFLRVDDDDNEIPVKYIQKGEPIESSSNNTELPKPTKEQLIKEFDTLVKNIEQLPQIALATPVTHYDLYSFMALISAILRDP